LNLEREASPLLKENIQTGEFLVNLLAFQLDRHIYTLPIDIISQIIDMVSITHLPEVSDSIEGIFNYHGRTVPVVNLRRYLNLPKLSIHLHTPIILVWFSGYIIGLIVDRVIGVMSHPQNSIFLPKDLLPDDLVKISILDGVVQTSENYMLMLNLENLFTSQRKQALVETLDRLATPSLDNIEKKITAKSEHGDGNRPDHQQNLRSGNHKPRKQTTSRKKSVEISSNSTAAQESTD
jgi:purine-binding chemotaxis protein CheW